MIRKFLFRIQRFPVAGRKEGRRWKKAQTQSMQNEQGPGRFSKGRRSSYCVPEAWQAYHDLSFHSSCISYTSLPASPPINTSNPSLQPPDLPPQISKGHCFPPRFRREFFTSRLRSCGRQYPGPKVRVRLPLTLSF